LSGLLVKVVHLVLDSVNLLISLATFGKTDRFFHKTPTEKEMIVMKDKLDALMLTHDKLKVKFDEFELSEQKIIEDNNTPGLG